MDYCFCFPFEPVHIHFSSPQCDSSTVNEGVVMVLQRFLSS